LRNLAYWILYVVNFCYFVNFVELVLEKTCFQKIFFKKEKKKEISSIPSLLLISLLFSINLQS
jgi:hypothetical protein